MRAPAVVPALLTALALLACNRASVGGSDPAQAEVVADVEAWRKGRLERLQSETGWLAVAGLYWLKEGVQPAGSAEDSDLRFPAGGPPKLGTFELRAGKVTFTAAPGAEVRQVTKGKPGEKISQIALQDDAEGERDPTMLTSGTFTFFVIKRGARLGVRLRDTAAKARKSFHGIEHYPVDARYRVTARWEPLAKPERIPIPTILGTIDQMDSPGFAAFKLDGRELRLQPVIEPGDDKLFFIFADATSGKQTYGAGRFLYAAMPEKGAVVLDFNKAYNPPCAFTPYATCPLPPAQNRLPVAVTAGEKNYGHH